MTDTMNELLNNSFRFSQSKKYQIKNNDIPYIENEKDEDTPKEKFLYADRVTHRTHLELDKFLKKKKLEKKKEEREEIQKKQQKILNTLQNLIRLGEQCKSNKSPNKYRK